MTSPYERSVLPTVYLKFQLASLLLLFILTFNASAHSLAVDPAMPTASDSVTILVTGDWPGGGGPGITGWVRSDTSIRIDAFGVLPGIPQPIIPYQLMVDIGRLPPGHFYVDYYIDVLAAPGPSPESQGPLAPLPDATLEFDVLASTAPIPALSIAALTLLVALFLVLARQKTGTGFTRKLTLK